MRSTVEKPEAAPVDLPIEWTVPWKRTHGPCENNPDCGSHPDYSRADFGMPMMTEDDLCRLTNARAVAPCNFYDKEFMRYRERYAEIHGVDPHAQPDRRARENRRAWDEIRKTMVCARKKAQNDDLHISEKKDVKVENEDKDNNSDVDDSDDDLHFSDNDDDDDTIEDFKVNVDIKDMDH